MGLSYW